ncbi:envelope-like protein, partial [Trifolium medium]|nr:envelope-like protein [Trifolium medium]
ISFHSEESVKKCKYVYQRRITHERELSREALECKEVMELLESANMMKTVTNIESCYERLVKEFIVNISEDCSEGSEEFRKVYVRGRCVNSSPITINEYLGRSETIETEEVDLLGDVTEIITGGQEKQWPKKGLLSTGKLSVKYAILNKIGAVNWTPTNHSSGITPM